MNDDAQVRMAEAVEILEGIFDDLGFEDYGVAMSSGGIYVTCDVAMDDIEAWYDRSVDNG